MRLALATAVSLSLTVPTAAQRAVNEDIVKAAAAASRFSAIKAFCPEAIPTDKVEADKYVDVYADVAIKFAGVSTWAQLYKAQVVQRMREVKVIGPQRWCEDQRRYLRELGVTTVFP